jgi:hypothetical protein
MHVSASRTAAFALTFLTLAVASGHAQVAPPPQQAPPPVAGFVPPYEIMRTLRSAGFDPLAAPLREGATYVARATDYRGILMRVVLDARTGAIRDANRIVPGPGSDARLGTPPYELPPDSLPPPEVTGALPLPRPAPRASIPLPRQRPADLAAKPTDRLSPAVTPPDAKSEVTGSVPAVAAPAPIKPSRVPPPLTINN